MGPDVQGEAEAGKAVEQDTACSAGHGKADGAGGEDDMAPGKIWIAPEAHHQHDAPGKADGEGQILGVIAGVPEPAR